MALCCCCALSRPALERGRVGASGGRRRGRRVGVAARAHARFARRGCGRLRAVSWGGMHHGASTSSCRHLALARRAPRRQHQQHDKSKAHCYRRACPRQPLLRRRGEGGGVEKGRGESALFDRLEECQEAGDDGDGVQPARRRRLCAGLPTGAARVQGDTGGHGVHARRISVDAHGSCPLPAASRSCIHCMCTGC